MQLMRIISMFGLAALCVAMPSRGGEQQDRELSPAANGSRSQPELSKMKVTLKEGFELQGNPIDVESITMNSLIGEVDIPIHTIAGIRFAQQPGEQTTLVLLNGDAITGELTLSDIKFVSDWGEAKVNVDHLVSIVFRPDFAWSEVGTPNGKRWRLTKVDRPQGNFNYNGARIYTSRPR